MPLVDLGDLYLQRLKFFLDALLLPSLLAFLSLADAEVFLCCLDADFHLPSDFIELFLFGLELLFEQLAASEICLVIVHRYAHLAGPGEFVLE